MSYHPRIETDEFSSFVTTRSRNSELWFVNNQPLETATLGYLARCQERYGVKLYAFAIEGNHHHMPASFPGLNRSSFMRDFNSIVAKAVAEHTPEYPGGRFWGRRYSQEFLPGDDDIEEKFFYTVLQPVQDGLVEKLSEYPGYNCFHDAVNGIERKFKLVNWSKYNAAKRYNPKVPKSRYVEEYTLRYERLPGHENLSQKEYAKLMHEKLEERRIKIVAERLEEGQGFLGKTLLLEMKRGATPKNTKTSSITDHRARVLSVCPIRRQECLEWYFDCYYKYKACSKRYRAGDLTVEFPKGMYPPVLMSPQE